MSLSKKIDFAVIFAVKNANPNGDPLNGNRPRTTQDGFGEMSDVCIKRKIRDRLQEVGLSIYVQSEDRADDYCISLRDRFEKSEVRSKDKETTIKKACEKWFDVRAFGQLFPFASKNKGKNSKKQESETEDAASDDSVSIGIRGPVSIHPAFSLEQINVTTSQITKSVSGDGDGKKKGSDTMGTKHRVDLGTYVFYGSMNPQLATITGFSDEDANKLKAILPKLFENDASSARPEGSMQVLKLVWWEHSSQAGQYSSAKVHSSLKISRDGNLEIQDLPGLRPQVIEGF